MRQDNNQMYSTPAKSKRSTTSSGSRLHYITPKEKFIPTNITPPKKKRKKR